MVTLATSVPAESARATSAPSARPSLLRMGLGGRLAIAGAAVALLWSAIALGIA